MQVFKGFSRVRNCFLVFLCLKEIASLVSGQSSSVVFRGAVEVESTHSCHTTCAVSGSSMEVNPTVFIEGVEPSPDDFTWTNLAMVWILGTSLMFHIMILVMLCQCCCSSSPATTPQGPETTPSPRYTRAMAGQDWTKGKLGVDLTYYDYCSRETQPGDKQLASLIRRRR